MDGWYYHLQAQLAWKSSGIILLLYFRFVGYDTVAEAETAIQKFDGLDVGQGSRLKVALALTKQKPTFTDLEPTVHTVNGTTDSAERYLVISWCVQISLNCIASIYPELQEMKISAC